MLSHSRILALVACVAILSGTGSAQLQPFPSWVASLLAMDYDSSLALAPSVYAQCSSAISWRLEATTDRAYLDPWYLWAQQNQGVLAVFDDAPGAPQRRLGGIDTGFTNILHLDGPFRVPGLPDRTYLATVTGILPSGLSGVKCLKLFGGQVPDPQCLLTLPVNGLPGEVYTAASFVGNVLFIFEGVTPKIIAYLDTDMDLIPDTRSSLVLDLAAYPNDISTGTRYPSRISGFLSCDPSEGICRLEMGDVEHGHEPNYDVVYLKPTGELGLRNISNFKNVPLGLPAFGHGGSSIVSANQNRIAVRGTPGNPTVVEIAPSETGPWTARTPHFNMPKENENYVVTLNAPLTEGEFVRVRKVADSSGAHVKRVTAVRPVLFNAALSTKVAAGSTLDLHGDNLDGPVIVRFVPSFGDGPGTAPLAVSRQTKHQLKVALPAGLAPEGKSIMGWLTVFRVPPGGVVTECGIMVTLQE